MKKTLPRAGWQTHTEQTGPEVGSAWHMRTQIDAKHLVVSSRISETAFELQVLQSGRTIEAALVHTAAEARDNHYIAVQAVIDAKTAAASIALRSGKSVVRA